MDRTKKFPWNVCRLRPGWEEEWERRAGSRDGGRVREGDHEQERMEGGEAGRGRGSKKR